MKRKLDKENWQENMIKIRSDNNDYLKKVKDELGEIENCVPSADRRVMNDEVEFKKLEKEVNDMKTVMDSQLSKKNCHGCQRGCGGSFRN